jgi:hypothetical protein
MKSIGKPLILQVFSALFGVFEWVSFLGVHRIYEIRISVCEVRKIGLIPIKRKC